MKVQGGGEMTFLGLSIYDGYYWSEKPGWSADLPCALSLRYHRSLNGARLADRSVSEIERLGYGTPEQLARWGAQMKRIFPDVRSGDELTGVNVPNVGVSYFHNGKPIGEIADIAFAKAFFGIWLDPKTSRPDFRSKLLGVR